MSDATTFPASQQPGANHGFGNSAFQHTSLDPDASARLAAMDRALTEDTIFPSQVAPEFLHPEERQSGSPSDSDSQSVSHDGPPEEDALPATLIAESVAAHDKPRATVEAAETQGVTDPAGAVSATDAPEIEFSEIQSSDLESAQAAPAETVFAEPAVGEVTGIFSIAEAGGVILHHQSAPETTAEEITLIETTIIEADLNSGSEAAAPAPLEVSPILDASGELEPEADQYTPPAPFEIHVPNALAVDEAPVVAATEDNVTGNAADGGEPGETYNLELICVPNEVDEIVEQTTAQEEAVAEVNAAAAEFVAEQIASESAANDSLEMAKSDGNVSAAQTATSPATTVSSSLAGTAQALRAEPVEDRRRKRRALISSPIRVRGIHVTTGGPDEITSTVDVSRYGILFHTVLDTYQRGMDVAVVFPYHKSVTGAHAEQFGRVVRLHELPDGRQAVALALGVGVGEHLVDSNGRQLASEPVQLSNSPAPQVRPPMVLAIDSDTMLRDTIKLYLQNEGYEVIAVSTPSDAREVLNMFMPAMIVAEMEGEGDLMPGLDLCAHVKSSPSLKRIPVVLTSRSGYPSDYSNAHSLGAVVCMAKPYKMERLGHIVRLLAPLPEQLQPACTQRPPDPTRGFGRDSNVTQRGASGSRNTAKKTNGNGNVNGAKSRFKFPSFR
jgi:CheY-like chemotaxis protein